jgi:tRNA nucleotidyltransferase (CCA-adding enzyme)
VARRAFYPQVEPGAEALIDARVAALPRGADVAAALRVSRRRDVALLASDGRVVLRVDLVRAAALGLGSLPAASLARPVPVVEPRSPEVRVRRALAGGAPAVLVRESAKVGAASATVGAGRATVGAERAVRRGIRGAATAAPEGSTAPAIAARLARRLTPAALEVLSRAGELAAHAGGRAWLVGGVVRDALRDGAPGGGDLDVVVEGDGHWLARALADAVGGRLVLHDRFLTASVETPDAGTIDVVTARSERYERPGALPRVMPAGIRQDLERRDFGVNAMAVELGTAERRLLDPLGGRGDLAHRRLRVLHPLSFVEDPTRMFRAARYAARLGYALDAWSARCQRLALTLAPYEALSGARVCAELDHVLRDVAPATALGLLGTSGAFRLLDRRYRFTARTAAHVAALGMVLASSEARVALELALLVLLGDQPPAVASAALRRLGLSGEPLGRLERALAGGAALAAAIASAPTPSARAALLRGRGPAERSWLALTADPAVHAAVVEFAAAGDVAPALRGDDVIALGVPRGPAVARVLAALRDARLDGEVRDRDGEAAYVRHWVETRQEG